MGSPGALLHRGGAVGRLRSCFGAVEEARTRWRRRQRRWLAVVLSVCVACLALSLWLALSGDPVPSSRNRIPGACVAAPSGCRTGRAGTAAALASGHWQSISPGPLSSRIGQTAVWTGRRLLVWGGVHQSVGSGTSQPPLRALSDGAAYDPTTRSWRMVSHGPLSPRAGAVGVWTGTEAIFWGGYAPGSRTTFYADGAAYDPATGQWSRLPPAPLSPRAEADAFWTGTRLLVFGGDQSNHTPLDDGAIYRPSTDSWSRVPALPKDPGATLVGSTAAWTGHRLLVWLTYEAVTNPSPATDTIRAFQRSFSWSIGTSAWRRLPTPPIGVFTYGATATWTGHRVLLVGGSDCVPGVSCAAAVGRTPLATYDPTTAAWGRAPGDPDAVQAGPLVWSGRALVALNPVLGDRAFREPVIG